MSKNHENLRIIAGIISAFVLALSGTHPVMATNLPPIAPEPLSAIAKPALSFGNFPQGPSAKKASTVNYNRSWIAQHLGKKNQVLLTFDDGPHPRTTPRVLEVLRENNLKGVFFVLGVNARKFPHLVKQIHDEGHTIGNHGYSHANLTKLSHAAILREIRITNDLISEITGKKPRLFRPPYGAINESVSSAVSSEGMSVMLWNIDPSDWRHKDSSRSVSIITRQMRLDSVARGGIILMHDNIPSTIETLRVLLPVIRRQLYIVCSETMGEPRNIFKIVTSPTLMQKKYSAELDLNKLNRPYLSHVIKPARARPLNSVALLRAKKTGRLLQAFAGQSI